LLHTLELTHPRFSQRWLFVARRDPLTATLEDKSTVTFDPFPFTIAMPNVDAQGQQILQISLCNIGQEMMGELEHANEDPRNRVEVVYRIFLASDTSEPQTLPYRLTLDAVAANDLTVIGEAGRSDVLNQRFARTIYTSTLFPGLRR
jgi:hypothetical protein